MKSLLISSLVAAVLAFAAAWTVQGWRYDAEIEGLKGKHQKAMSDQALDLAEQRTEQIRHVLKAERSQRAQVDQALAAARGREVALQRDVAAVRAQRDGLRDAADAAVRMSGESHGACLSRVAAFREVFDQCAARYGEVAERADRHASDVRTLIEAWPGPAAPPVPRMADSAAPKQE